MPTIGKRAIVVGAGIGGLTTAGALAEFFETVLVARAGRAVAARNPAIHKLTAEVGNLLKPRTAYRDRS